MYMLVLNAYCDIAQHVNGRSSWGVDLKGLSSGHGKRIDVDLHHPSGVISMPNIRNCIRIHARWYT